ncbi:MAG TPA: hypothetical protein VKE22_12945 [Haliangiales bacterium]|nr:hypothetical protein [Haliangiales bacterium]
MSRLVVFLVVAGLSVPAAAQNKLAGEVDALARQVSKLRGLPVKRPIARGVLTRDQIEKRILERIAEDYAEADVAGEERCMKRLGLFPADLDYKDVMVKLLREQVAGFYDPYRKELYLADWIADEMQKIVMVHEIDHALQDQSFDLVKFTQPKKDNGDEQVARQALVEGDGVAVMFEYMMPGSDPWADDRVANMMGLLSGLSGGAEFDKAPLLLRETLLFSYEKGLRFVAAARKTRPWSDIDAMYANPPQSTEQILHPEKYRAREKPIAIKPGKLATLAGWKRVWSNVLGELVFSIYFREWGIEKARALRAAEGWGGDRVQLFAPPDDDGKRVGALVLIDESAWDAEADAVEAFDALVEAAAKANDKQIDKQPTYAEWTSLGAVTTFVERRKDRVVYAIGVPPALAPKLRAELWASWKR